MNRTWSRLKHADTSKLTWTKAMSVGNKTIDAEHEKIICLVNKVEQAFKSRETEAVSKVFAQLEETIATHFNNHARIAEAIAHPFEKHLLEHQYVLGELQTIKTDLVSGNGRWSESAAEYYYSFLSEWVNAHIGLDDRELKSRLQAYPYNFAPPDTPK